MTYGHDTNRSAYMARGDYEPVAERLFGGGGSRPVLLEYDTERAGGFEPLRFIRPGTMVVDTAQKVWG
jgi:hypothetical protein